MEVNIIVLLLSLVLDMVVGDPRWLPHPTQIMGMGIEGLKKRWLKPAAPRYLFVRGLVTVVVIVSLSYLATWLILKTAAYIDSRLYVALSAWLLATCIAPRGLAAAAVNIGRALKDGNLNEARVQVGYIVGRDTYNLDEGEVVRATVETVAENTGDGIVAPLFFYLIGGVPLAMTYRAVNTLDSMLGYKNDNYLYFGRAAAKLDDAANYIPSRLSGLAICAAALFYRAGGRSLAVMVRDAGKHPSPNSGFPEAAMAGALGLRLGGMNYYQGILSQRAYMGDPLKDFSRLDIFRAVYLMLGATLITICTGILYLKFVGPLM